MKSSELLASLVASLAVALTACATAPQASPASPGTGATPAGPYVLVLGTAQDGGLPQIGCTGAPCVRAREDDSRARRVTSLLLVDPPSGRRWLFDASPDLREQVELARGHPLSREHGARAKEGPRPPLFDGIFLTHAHVGHYTGLLHLGREVYGASGMALFASRQMGSFLRSNGPWSQIVQEGRVALLSLEPDLPIPLTSQLRVTPIPVPHRHEFADTLAFLIEGPERSVLYLPDIDKWERWDRRIEDVLARVDLALLDGTFYADGEIPGRSMRDIPHPFISESLERFRTLPAAERSKVVFTHLNHTNPAADPASEAAQAVRAAGMDIAREGQLIEL